VRTKVTLDHRCKKSFPVDLFLFANKRFVELTQIQLAMLESFKTFFSHDASCLDEMPCHSKQEGYFENVEIDSYDKYHIDCSFLHK